MSSWITLSPEETKITAATIHFPLMVNKIFLNGIGKKPLPCYLSFYVFLIKSLWSAYFLSYCPRTSTCHFHNNFFNLFIFLSVCLLQHYAILVIACCDCITRPVGDPKAASWRHPSDKERLPSPGGSINSCGSKDGFSWDNYARLSFGNIYSTFLILKPSF